MEEIIMVEVPTKWHKWHKKCKGCGTTQKPYHALGRCLNCYYKYRWKKNPSLKIRQRELTYKWKNEHPERWKEIVYKAIKKYQATHKEELKKYYRKRYERSRKNRKSNKRTRKY